MTTTEIKTALQQLHSEFAKQATPDPEVKELLRLLETDIHGLLEEPSVASAPATPMVTNRIDALAMQVEVEHPTLAPLLRQVSEALSRIGI